MVQGRDFKRVVSTLNATKTLRLGAYSQYVFDSNGVETRVCKQITLSHVKAEDNKVSKREAMRLLQPHLDKANASISSPEHERRSITFDALSEVWERDYLSLQKPASQSAMRSYLKRLRTAFDSRDMRTINAGDVQRLIALLSQDGSLIVERYKPNLASCAGSEVG